MPKKRETRPAVRTVEHPSDGCSECAAYDTDAYTPEEATAILDAWHEQGHPVFSAA